MKDKKSLPQMILLGVLVAACAGFIVVKVTGKKASPKPAAAKTQQSTAAKPQIQPPPPSPNVNPSGPVTVALRAGAPAARARRDPFTPTMDIWTRVVEPTSQPQRPTMIVQKPLPSIGPLVPTLTFGTGPGQPDRPAGQIGVVPADQQEKQFPQFVVTGIVTGRTNVAIIRLGKGRYICKEGQIIDGAYKVVSVSQDGVLLSRDGRSVFLKLGGEGNAS